MLIAFCVGAGLGFISAIPIAGPISAIVFGQSMKGRYAQARWIAAGAAIVEALYAFFAFWGMGQLLTKYRFVGELADGVAAVLLAGPGIYFFRSRKMREPTVSNEASNVSAFRGFLTGGAVCAVNPSLIATWGATVTTIFSMGIFEFSNLNAFLFSLGVALGIFVWFVGLSKIVEKHRDRFQRQMLDRILKGIGIGLVLLALLVAAHLFREILAG